MRDRLRPARIARRLSNARPGLTSLARGMLAAARIARHTTSARRLGLVLLFHRVAERDGDPRRELVPAVGVERFQQQLRWTRRLFRPVAAEEILAATRSRRRWHRIPLAITFDDEWPTHTTLALPALRAEGLRATFFLTGAQLDGPVALLVGVAAGGGRRGQADERDPRRERHLRASRDRHGSASRGA